MVSWYEVGTHHGYRVTNVNNNRYYTQSSADSIHEISKCRNTKPDIEAHHRR